MLHKRIDLAGHIRLKLRAHTHTHTVYKPFNRLALKVTLTVHMIFSKWCVLCCVDFFLFSRPKWWKLQFNGMYVCVCVRAIVWLFILLFIYLLSFFLFIRVQVSVVNVYRKYVFFSLICIWHCLEFSTHSTESKLKYWQI